MPPSFTENAAFALRRELQAGATGSVARTAGVATSDDSGPGVGVGVGGALAFPHQTTTFGKWAAGGEDGVGIGAGAGAGAGAGNETRTGIEACFAKVGERSS